MLLDELGNQGWLELALVPDKETSSPVQKKPLGDFSVWLIALDGGQSPFVGQQGWGLAALVPVVGM